MTRLAVLLISVIGAASGTGRARADGGTDGELASALALLTTLPADEPEAHELMDLLLPGERYGSCEDLCLPFLFEDDAEHRRLEQERQDRKVRLQVVYSLLALNAERSFPVLLRLFEENAGHVESGCPTPPGIPPPPDLRFPTDMVMMDQDLPPLVWRWGDGQCRSWEVKDEKIVVALRVLRVLQLMRPGKSRRTEFRRVVEKIALRLYNRSLPCAGPAPWIRAERSGSKGSAPREDICLAITGRPCSCPDELVIRIALRVEKGW